MGCIRSVGPPTQPVEILRRTNRHAYARVVLTRVSRPVGVLPCSLMCARFDDDDDDDDDGDG